MSEWCVWREDTDDAEIEVVDDRLINEGVAKTGTK
jgi:hypothetical protein